MSLPFLFTVRLKFIPFFTLSNLLFLPFPPNIIEITLETTFYFVIETEYTLFNHLRDSTAEV